MGAPMFLGIILAIFTFWIVSRNDRWDTYKTWEQCYLIVMLVINLVWGGYQVLAPVMR
jgi:hypothetical protein